jgi:hypothetical protein
MVRVLALAVCVMAACGGDQPPPRATTNATTRPVTPRSKLPAAIQPLLPRHGVYVAGGGMVSSAWRVVLDLEAKTLYGGSAAASNAPSFGPMDKESRKDLSPRNEQLLMELSNAAWTEVPPDEPLDATADYDEIFIVVSGDDAFFLQGYGPIRRPLAAKAIVELRAAAGL